MSDSLDHFVRDALNDHDGIEGSDAPTILAAKPGAAKDLGTLPGHVVEGFIARGGMGAVYRAKQAALEREVAVKVMTGAAESPEMAERFRREALVLGRLEHPNIVPIYELGTDDEGQLFYTMKLVKGRTLQQILIDLRAEDAVAIKEHTLPSLLTVFRKVCDAMSFAHSQGIIHRDLKPENVMVGEFGEVLVMDWGLAKMTGSQVGRTVLSPPPEAGNSTHVSSPDRSPGACNSGAERTQRPTSDGFAATLQGSVMGTPQYMSPEQAMGLVDELDARSDLFSLGGILYAILTLRPPVEGKTLEEVLDKVRTGSIASPSAFGATAGEGKKPVKGKVLEARKITPLPHIEGGKVPAALSAVVMKALTLDKTKRYQDVAAFSADIEAFQGGFATTAEHAGLTKQLALLIKRNKGIFTTAAAAWFIVTALAVWFVFNLRAKEQRAIEGEQAALTEKEAARLSSARANLSLADAAQREGNGPEMQAALGEVPEDLRDATWRYLIDQADTSIARIRTGAEAVEGVAAHPRRPGVFAVADSKKKVALIELRTGARLLEFTPEFPRQTNGDRYRLAFSPDGERIAVGRHGDGGIVIHSARDGQKLLGWTAPPTEELEFSADGRLLLQHTIPRTALKLWDAASGQPAWEYVPPRGSNFTHGAYTPDGQQVLTIGYGDDFRLVGARDGAVIRSFKSEGDVITALAVAGNGTAAASVDRKGFVQVLDLRAGRVLLRFRAHEGRIGFLAFTPAGDQLVTAFTLPDGRQAIHVWLAATGERRQVLLGGSGEIRDIGVQPLTGELLVSGPNARAWSLTGRPPVWNIAGTALVTRPVFWGSDDVLFADGRGQQGLLQKLQPGTPAILWKPAISYGAQADVSADGRLAVYGWGAKESVLALLRNPGTQPEEVRTIKLKDGPNVLRLSAGGERVAMAADQNRRTELFDTATGLPMAPLERGDVKRFWSLGWLGSGGQRLVGLVTAKADRGLSGSEEWIVLWDAATGKIVQRVTNRTAMDVLVVAPDGSRFAEAGADKMVRIRDAATLAVQQEFRAHDGPVTALAWHPVKPILATASADLTVRLWNLDTGRRLEELRGPLTAPNGLGFSPSGQRLACASPNDATRIWEPESLNEKPAPASPTDGDWEDLLAPLTPTIVAQTGNGWHLEGGALFSPGKPFATLPLPGDLSGTSYTVRVKLRQLTAKNDINLQLPVGDRMVGFHLDGSGGKWTSLVLVNGKWGKDLPGALEGKQVKDSEQHDLEVTVDLAGSNVVITTTLDGQPLYSWAGPTAALSQHASWKTAPGTLALGAMSADWVVYEVKVKRLQK